MNCAIRVFITKLRSSNIIDENKAKELRANLEVVHNTKATGKQKLKAFKNVFQDLASKSNVTKGGPSVRPQPRSEPQPGDASRPMTISDLPQAKTIEQIQRTR